MFLFKTLKLVNISKIKWDKIEVTTLCINPEQSEKQAPHTYYEIVQTNSPDNLAWTAHLPLNKNEGSYLYIWTGTGCRTAVHIKGGQCLLLCSDVVHSGGIPEAANRDKKYILDYISTYLLSGNYLLLTDQ